MEQVIIPAISAQDKTNALPEKKSAPLFNALLLAYLYLVEASTIYSESALVKAKGMQGNANAQQRLNNEQARLQWYQLPKEILDHHKAVRKYGYFKGYTLYGSPIFHTTHVAIHTWTTVKNDAVVQEVEAKNEAQMGIRNILTNQAQVLQQQAQGESTQVEVLSDEALTTIQLGSAVMNMARTLGFKALLRNPPQN